MRVLRILDFADKFEGQIFFVGFLKGQRGWFPLSRVGEDERLDTLIVTQDRERMEELLEKAEVLLTMVRATYVEELYAGEVFNRAQRYELDFIQIVG